MEQKMLLPIIVIVLIGGFIIGYYAAAAGGGTAKASKGTALSAGSQGIVSKAQYTEFFQAQTFTQFLKGNLVSTTGDSVVITQNGKNLAIKKPRATSYFLNTASNKLTVSEGDLVPGEEVNAALSIDPDTGMATSLVVTALR